MAQPSSCASLAPSSCSAVPSTTSARTPSWKPRRATGANRSRAVTPSSRTRDGSISIVWRSKERLRGGVQRTLDALQEVGEGLHLLGRGPVEDDGRQVEQHAVEQRGPVVLRRLGEVQRERGGAVLEVAAAPPRWRPSRRRPRPACARPTHRCATVARGGEPVEVGRAARSGRRRCRRASCALRAAQTSESGASSPRRRALRSTAAVAASHAAASYVSPSPTSRREPSAGCSSSGSSSPPSRPPGRSVMLRRIGPHSGEGHWRRLWDRSPSRPTCRRFPAGRDCRPHVLAAAGS